MAASNNDVDITVVESESDDDSQSSEEFNFAVALQLRKNLSSTFEQHIHSSNVSDKIARFEQQSNNSDKLPPRPAVAVAVPAVKSTPLGVYLRVRPISSEHVATVNTIEIQPTTKQSQVPTTVRTFPPVDSNAYKVVREESSGGVKEFEFAQVFGPESTQQQVYNTVAAPLVSGLFPSSNGSTGESALLFAYGITNAGKTHTIMGSAKQKEMRGIIPRALQDIFSHMQSRTGYSLNMSYMEIYNEGIYDLLPKKEKTKTFVGASRESLKLRESRHGQTFVRGLAKHKVKSVEHGLELVQQASSKRHTSSNNINSDSSRSHCICQLEVSIESPIHSSVINSNDMEADDDDDDNSVSTANGYNTDDEAVFLNKKKSVTLWIVDLAGSERSKRTGVIQGSTRQKEAALINSSLMKLMRCLNVMRRNQSTSMTANVVPFRESKLTHLFMNHLTGTSASRTLMIVNVNPAVADFDETQHVLAYATAARSVQISQEDFHRKRKDISAGGDALEATHDYNGRALKKLKSNNKGGAVTTSSTNGAASKISKLVKRFSPKNMGARKPAAVDGDSKKRKMMESQKESSKSLSSTDSVAEQPNLKTSRFANMRAQGKPKEAPSQQHGTTTASNKEIKQLKMSLSVAQAEAELLRSEKNQLEEQLSQHEAQVRMEIAQDMEEQMQIMREQYNGIIDNLKSQVHSNPTPSKSVKKAQMDKVDSLIDELMDKVDECEDEMKRMRESHAAEIASLEEKYGKALSDKDKELSELDSSHKQAAAQLEATIKDLQSKLGTSQESYAKLEKSKKEMMENYEQLIREQDEEETEDEDDSDGEESSPTPVRRGRQQQQETGGTKQMVRSRTSKVAVQSMETEYLPKLSGKKTSRELHSKRTPLSPIPINKNSSDLDDRDCFGPDQWLRPKKPVEICELTGSFLRPRGRAPSGREWDEKVGAWRLSMAG
jgi:hypothetical protein